MSKKYLLPIYIGTCKANEWRNRERLRQKETDRDKDRNREMKKGRQI